MRKFNQTVFDEYLAVSTTTYTSQELNARLGQMDQLALHMVTDNVGGANGSITARIMHSSDGRNWMYKNGAAEVTVGATTSSLPSMIKTQSTPSWTT